jgi:hypothetical protein
LRTEHPREVGGGFWLVFLDFGSLSLLTISLGLDSATPGRSWSSDGE